MGINEAAEDFAIARLCETTCSAPRLTEPTAWQRRTGLRQASVTVTVPSIGAPVKGEAMLERDGDSTSLWMTSGIAREVRALAGDRKHEVSAEIKAEAIRMLYIYTGLDWGVA